MEDFFYHFLLFMFGRAQEMRALLPKLANQYVCGVERCCFWYGFSILSQRISLDLVFVFGQN